METIPIFPLNTVLFPGGGLPLRIFEPRYRAMLKDCIAGDRRFGIVSIRTGQEVGGAAVPCDIGTIALIENVREESREAIPIETRGTERFKLVSSDRSGVYLTGEVEILSDHLDPAAGPAADRANLEATRYLNLLFTFNGEYEHKLELPEGPLELSYLLGTVLLSRPAEIRQLMLEAETVSKRLEIATEELLKSISELESGLMRSGPGENRSLFGLN